MVAHKSFQEFDATGKGYVTGEDIKNYLKNFYIRVTTEEAEALIKEFDASEDGTLITDEFQQIILPSANQNLRRMAELRVFSYSYKADNGQCE